ncbi:MAG: hypothetical protein WAW61_06280 [Methylococcaceae bacterium]
MKEEEKRELLIYQVSGHKKCYEELNPEPTATVTISAANLMVALSPRKTKLKHSKNKRDSGKLKKSRKKKKK